MNEVFAKCFIFFVILNCLEGRRWKLTKNKWNKCQKVCKNENEKYINLLQICYNYEKFNTTVTNCIAICLHSKRGRYLFAHSKNFVRFAFMIHFVI